MLETALGRPVPTDYRAFLEAANGSNLDGYAIRLPGKAVQRRGETGGASGHNPHLRRRSDRSSGPVPPP